MTHGRFALSVQLEQQEGSAQGTQRHLDQQRQRLQPASIAGACLAVPSCFRDSISEMGLMLAAWAARNAYAQLPGKHSIPLQACWPLAHLLFVLCTQPLPLEAAVIQEDAVQLHRVVHLLHIALHGTWQGGKVSAMPHEHCCRRRRAE